MINRKIETCSICKKTVIYPVYFTDESKLLCTDCHTEEVMSTAESDEKQAYILAQSDYYFKRLAERKDEIIKEYWGDPIFDEVTEQVINDEQFYFMDWLENYRRKKG